jgi:hypothetical protein
VKPKRFYLVLGILGAVLLYSQFVPWLGEHGVNDRLFAQQLFATCISTFFALDVIVSAAVVLRFIRAGRRLRINHAWLAISHFAGRRFAGPAAISVSSRTSTGTDRRGSTFLGCRKPPH